MIDKSTGTKAREWSHHCNAFRRAVYLEGNFRCLIDPVQLRYHNQGLSNTAKRRKVARQSLVTRTQRILASGIQQADTKKKEFGKDEGGEIPN